MLRGNHRNLTGRRVAGGRFAFETILRQHQKLSRHGGGLSTRIRSIVSGLALLLTACPTKGTLSDTNSSPQSQTLTRGAGDTQSATAGQPVPVAPTVVVTSQSGAPATGVPVTFSVASGGGSVTGAVQATSAAGVATVGSWTLGQTAGPNSLVATAGGQVLGSPVTFTATGTAGAAASLVKSLGDAQQGAAGQNVATAPAVTVRDQFGNPVASVGVTFAVTSGGGSVTGASQVTNGTGVAGVGTWRLGNTPGPNTLTATTAGSGISGNPASFAATGVIGMAAVIAKVAGDNQSAVAGTAVATAPIVRVTDAAGNAVNGAGVTFAPASGGGTVNGGSQLTGVDGNAKPSGWTLGTTAGANTLSASAAASGVTGSPLIFTATGIAGLNVAAYAGTWTGPWVNTTFGSSGTSTLVIAQGTQSNQVTITHSATGTSLGNVGGAPAETRSNVPFTPSVFTLQTVSSTYGNVTLNVDATGNLVGTGTQIPNPAISRWDCTGTITTTQIRVNFTVTFVSGMTAVGTTTLIKQ